MKRVFVNEEWCLGCRLCEYNCSIANSGLSRIVRSSKDIGYVPNVHVEACETGSYPVMCRHCVDPICVKSCISAALSKTAEGLVKLDAERCVGCLTCVLVCPYGAITVGLNGKVQKCELCSKNSQGIPACVLGCPNHALVYEERN